MGGRGTWGTQWCRRMEMGGVEGLEGWQLVVVDWAGRVERWVVALSNRIRRLLE